MTKSYHPSKEKRGKNLILDLLGYYDIKEVITDIAHGEADLDTLKSGASLIPVAKITKVPKVVKAIGNVGKTGLKKGKEGDKTVWKRFTQEDKPKPDKNKGNQSKTGSKGSTTTSKPNQEETSKSSQVKQTKAKNKRRRDSEHMLGENGTQIGGSKTTGKNGSTERVDVENPNPGVRPGDLHYHESNNIKWRYNVNTGNLVDPDTGELAPPSVQKVMKETWFQKAIKNIRRIIMIKEWVTNKKMKKLLNDISNSSIEEEFKIELEQLKKLFFPPFKQVKDCVIFSEKSVNKLEETFDKAMGMYLDKTGYEASNTETQINSFFEDSISMEFGTKLALMVLKVWKLQLKDMNPQSNFCLIISCDEDRVEIRFHQVRENEKMWLDEELEHYKDEAIGYVII